MNEQEIFERINTTMDMANGSGSDLLGGLVILSAVFTEFCLAEVVCAEADKINSVVNRYYGRESSSVDSAESSYRLEHLARLNDSVGNVLDKVCCIEGQINRKIEQGRALRND